jgi:hypothetical protein
MSDNSGHRHEVAIGIRCASCRANMGYRQPSRRGRGVTYSACCNRDCVRYDLWRPYKRRSARGLTGPPLGV